MRAVLVLAVTMSATALASGDGSALFPPASGGVNLAAAVDSTVASGSRAFSLLQGARLTFDGTTGAKYLSSDGTTLTLTGLTLTVPATGIIWSANGTLSSSSSVLTWNGGQINAGQFISTNALAKFGGGNTQTTATLPGATLYGFASNQANQLGVDIGIQTTWSGLNSQRIVRFGHSGVGGGAGTFPLSILGTGKLNFYNSASNAADVVGTATLVGGTVPVATTAVEAGDKIFLTCATPGGTQGFLSVGTITAGTSFVINSSSASDTSTVNWWIVKKS